MLRLVRIGTQTFAEARETIRVPPKLARFLSPDELWYRMAIAAEFENLLRPGSARVPEPPPSHAPPPPPAEQQPRRTVPRTPKPRPEKAEKAPPAPTVARTRGRRGPMPRPAHPPEQGDAVLAQVAAHFGITVEDLSRSRQGVRPGNGIPRWTAALALRTVAGLFVREIAERLGYCDSAAAYLGLHSLAARRRANPELDRDISMLLGNMRARRHGTEPHARETAHSPKSRPSRRTQGTHARTHSSVAHAPSPRETGRARNASVDGCNSRRSLHVYSL